MLPLSAKRLRNRAEAQAASAPDVKGLQVHAREGDQDDTSFEDGGGTSEPEEWSVTLGGWRGNRGGWRSVIHSRPHLCASQSNISRPGQKGRLPAETLPGSVYPHGPFPGLVDLQEDLDQRQDNGHSHRQEERDVDGKLLVIREIEEVEERGIKKGTLRGRHSFPTGDEGRGQVPRGQLQRCLIDCVYSPVHLGRGQGGTSES